MTASDKLVAADLASLARDSRHHLRTVDESLRKLDLGREPGAAASVSALGIDELVLIPMATVFAHRVARAAAGAMAVVWSIVLLVALADPAGCDPAYDLHETCSISSAFIDRGWKSFALLVGVFVIGTYLLASRLAERRFERMLRDAAAGGRQESPLELGRQLVRSADGWSIVFGIAGVTSVVTLFGVIWFSIADNSWIVFWGGIPMMLADLVADRVRDLVIVIPAMLIPAFALGRVCVRRLRATPSRWLRALARSTIPIGLFVGFVTLCVGVENDVGSIGDVYIQGSMGHASNILRTVLTITGSVAVFVTMTGLTLWRRRREHARCGITS